MSFILVSEKSECRYGYFNLKGYCACKVHRYNLSTSSEITPTSTRPLTCASTLACVDELRDINGLRHSVIQTVSEDR